MLEVELKAWADLASARARLEALGKKPAKRTVKLDVYFRSSAAAANPLDPVRDKVVRLRVDDDHVYVTAKKKTISQGIETSEEIELGVHSAEEARAFLGYIGFEPFLTKKKESEAWPWREGLTVELNRVDGLGELVEIEALVPSGAGSAAVEAVRTELRSVLRALEIDEAKIEARSYRALLAERGVGSA